ncbi:archaetidylserine decarboxylase [Bdellovibrionales bacterium]|nr:archaetidylserine decarboxylase [Bdellovibrionales bacterium]
MDDLTHGGRVSSFLDFVSSLTIFCKFGGNWSGMMFLIKWVPKNLLSYLVGVVVQIPLPAPLNIWSLQWFVGRYSIDMSEAEHPIHHYKTVGELFTRRLKEGLRPISKEEIVHPADGRLTSWGRLTEGALFQAKGRSYSYKKLVHSEGTLGSQEEERLKEGHFLTYYLSPKDYHRVHSPVEGKIIEAVHIPGYLWPVNEWSVNNIDELFAVNERVVVWIETKWGAVAVILVGATNVGKITVSFDPSLVTNQYPSDGQIVRKEYAEPISIEKGQELGVFNMGSTVIVLYPSSAFETLSERVSEVTRVGGALLPRPN